MVTKRNRGVLLDASKVRLAASKLDLHSSRALKEYYLEYHGIPDSKVTYHAWTGSQKIDIDKAKKLAACLRVPDYALLLLKDSKAATCAWQQLILNEEYQSRFSSFIDHSKTGMNLVQFSQDGHEDLPKVPLNAKWHIELRGNNGDFVFIILRSENSFFQLAPIDIYSYQFSDTKMRYPPKGSALFFSEKDGTGWRQLIAVRVTYLKHPIRTSHTGYQCTLDELNLFALQTLAIPGNAIAVDTYEFMLVDP